MSPAYADASFLVSLYSPDANSAEAVAVMNRTKAVFLLTPFCELELTNALRLRVFRKELDPTEAEADLHAFQDDLAVGVLSVQPMPAAAYTRAIDLSLGHTSTLGARALDILHVASALVLGATTFYTFDDRQRRLARAVGLTTRPAG